MSPRVHRIVFLIAIVGAATVALAGSVFPPHPMSGRGSKPPTAEWHPTSTDWGDSVAVGDAVERTIRLKNSGRRGNLVGTVSIEPSCAAAFSIVSGGGEYSLPPGASRTIVIRFSPPDTASYECWLRSGP